MKTVKSSKDITTLEVDDVVVFGDLEYIVTQDPCRKRYYLVLPINGNDKIFKVLNINKIDFIEKLGINAFCDCPFPETRSLEALTAIVSALFKEYEKQNELPKTWEEFCERNPVTPDEHWIKAVYSRYCSGSHIRKRDINRDKNVCVSLQEAKAFTAFMQLRQLRKCYVGNWEPDWTNCMVPKYNITCIEGVLSIFDTVIVQRSMSFPNSKLAKQFFNNFKDLLEVAKPLL